MTETSSEQINDQNHDHDYDPIISKKQDKYQIEKLENKFISANWRKWSKFLCFSNI